jgi:hypothetical protein
VIATSARLQRQQTRASFCIWRVMLRLDVGQDPMTGFRLQAETGTSSWLTKACAISWKSPMQG